MKGDFSRLFGSPNTRYSRVVAQQGRVSLDADWNEQMSLGAEALRAVVDDLLGVAEERLGVCVPPVRAGFGIVARGGWEFDGSSYLDLGHGDRFHLGRSTPFRIEMDVCPASGGELFSRIARRSDGRAHGECAVRLDANGFVWFDRLELHDDVAIVEEEIDDGAESRLRSVRSAWPLPFGTFSHVSAGYADGRIFIEIDGELAALDDARYGAHSRRAHALVGAGIVERVPSDFFRGRIDRLRIRRPSVEAEGVDDVYAIDHDASSERNAPARVPLELWLTAGRAYVAGTAIALDRSVPLAVGSLTEPVTAYLDVWERFVDAAQAPSLLEPALRGADTAGRAAIVARVRLLPRRIAERRLLAWQHDRGAMQLLASTQATIAENALYRVEIHAGGVPSGSDAMPSLTVASIDFAARRVTLDADPCDYDDWQVGRYVEFTWDDDQRQLAQLTSPADVSGSFTVDALPPCGDELPVLRPVASIKYSNENACASFRITQIDEPTRIVTVEVRPNAPFDLAKGDWVELSNDASVESGTTFDLALVTNVDDSAMPYVRVTLDRALPSALAGDVGGGAVLRRWSTLAANAPAAVAPVTAKARSLDGIFGAQFSDARYFTGDFWTFAARIDLGPSAVLDWPRENGQYASVPPVGIRHRYGIVAELHPRGKTIAVRDRRVHFRTLGSRSAPREEFVHRVAPELPAQADDERDDVVALPTQERRNEHHHHHYHDEHSGDGFPAHLAALAAPEASVPREYRDAGVEVRARIRRPRWRALDGEAPRHGPARSVTVRGVVYVLFEDATLWSFDAHRVEHRWTQLADPPGRECDGAGFVASDRHLFLIGGRSGTGALLNAVRRYDIENDAWVLCSPLPSARAHAAVAAAAGRIFVCGGVERGWFGREHRTDRCEEYVVGRDVWSTVFPMPERRSHAAALIYDDAVYVFGGRASRRRASATTFAYSIATGGWYERASMPAVCVDARVALLDGAAWLGGGDGLGAQRHVPLMRFRFEANAWSFAPALARHRERCAIAASGDELFTIAGTTPMGPVSTIERYADARTFRVFEHVRDDPAHEELASVADAPLE